jgi:hypothetical protein
MPRMLGHLESYKTRVQLIKCECDEIDRMECHNKNYFHSKQQQLGGLEDPINDAYSDMKIVYDVHLAVSRAAKESLTELKDQHCLKGSWRSRQCGGKSNSVLLVPSNCQLGYKTQVEL